MQHQQLLIGAVLVSWCTFSMQMEPGKVVEDSLFLKRVDQIINRDTLDDYRQARALLLDRCEKVGENSALLWRLAQCCYNLKELNKNSAKSDKKALDKDGLDFAKKALELNEQDADAHKWFAILYYQAKHFENIGEKFHAAFFFKRHIETALSLRNDDPSLYHLMGVFYYEAVNQLVFKSKVSDVFGENPKEALEKATKYFLLADQYTTEPWKMNSLLISKCFFDRGNLIQARKWFEVTAKIVDKTREDKKVAEEVERMRRNIFVNY